MLFSMHNFSFYLLTLFFMLCIVNIAGQFQGTRRVSRFTKPFLMPLLLAFVLTYLLPKEGFSSRVIFLSLALIFHTAGDIFLLFPLTIHFVSGLFCFLAGHVSYLFVFAPFFRQLPFFLILLLFIFVLIFASVTFILVKKVQKLPIAIASSFYAFTLSSLFASCLSFCISSFMSKSLSGLSLIFTLLVPFGALLFISSDVMNAYSRFYRRFKNRNFWVMFTYILAQSFIVLGFVFA